MLNKKSVIFLMIKVLIALVASMMLFEWVNMPNSEKIHEWDSNLTAEVVYKDGRDITYDNSFFELVSRGDTVKVTVHLPEDQKVKNGVLCFCLYHASCEAYFHNEEIYAYGQDLAQDHKMIGAWYSRIRIPDDAWGDSLELVFHVQENKAFSNLCNTAVIEDRDTYLYFFKDGVGTLMFFVAAVLFSLCGFLFGIINGKYSLERRKGMYIALFAFMISIYILQNYGMMNLLYSNQYVLGQVEYISLFFCPIPVLMYAYATEYRRVAKYQEGVALAVTIIFDIVATLLNFTTDTHFCTVLPFFHLLAFVDIILMLKFTFNGIKRRKGSELMLLIGFGTLLLFFVVDILRFNLIKLDFFQNSLSAKTIVPVGVAVFTITLLLSYALSVMSSFMGEQEKNVLKQKAYFDSMTGVSNYAGCREKLSVMEENGEEEYALVSFDINELQKVNDSLGHAKGDMMLRDFAKQLKEVFEPDAFVGRTGGDEFIAIVEGSRSKEIINYIEDLYEKINYLNRQEHRFYKIIASHGLVLSTRNKPIDIFDAMQTADERLQENKQSQKKRVSSGK